MHHPITRQILDQVDGLPYAEQRRVLDFARALAQSKMQGVPGKELVRFAGTISKEDLQEDECCHRGGVRTGRHQ